MPVNFILIIFNNGNLSFGPEHTEDVSIEDGQGQNKREPTNDEDLARKEEHADKTGAETSTGGHGEEFEAVDTTKHHTNEAAKSLSGTNPNSGQEEITRRWVWFCIKNYYTAPVNKFIFHLVWSEHSPDKGQNDWQFDRWKP